MQKVSSEYKRSMKSSLRERAYIMVSFGLVNQEAQAKASVAKGDDTYYSNNQNLFGEHTDDTIYATMEENFTRVDGSMFFLPRSNSSSRFYDTGIVSRRLLSDAQYEMVINLNTIVTDFKGLTINFGENYPVDFDIIGDTNTVEFRDNDQAEFTTEEVFYQTTKIRIVFYTMKNPQSRLRVYSIRFGYGLVYYNDSVLDSKLETYVSPIGADVPQIDFSVTFKNYDRYFNVDNPNSAINYLETGQEMDIMYGYQLPDSDEIEWVKGQHLWCAEWESDDNKAVIKCQDVFRNMDGEYMYGMYAANGKSYYQLATEILQDAGFETDQYYLDPRLKNLYSKNPMPRVKHKEALQIIANACRCTLSQSREGKIQIKSNFVPEGTVSSNGATDFSNVQHIMEDTDKDEYGTMANEYTIATGGMFLLGEGVEATRNTGYVSAAVSKDDCTFTINPKVTISLTAIRTYGSLAFDFGYALPAEFILRTFNNGEAADEFTIGEDEIDKHTVVIRNFNDFDVIEIEFTKTSEPNSRIVFNHFGLSEVADFTMERRDMTSSPKAIKQELVKEVIVPCYLYQNGNKLDNVVSEDVEITAGEERTYYIQEASYGYIPKLDDVTGQVTVVDWGNYYVTLRFLVTGTYRLDVQAYQYRIIERQVVKTLHTRGKTVTWKNPLISDMTMANDLADWLKEYYLAGIEYEYDTRGNPELDATDIIYQENEFRTGMKVNIHRTITKFQQAFSGVVMARRVGG